jgi:hypothetical protein
VSDKLAAKSLPDWDFVVSFVTACRAHAEQTGLHLHDELVDLASWDAAHLKLLRACDEGSADDRLAAAARTELGRRDHRAGRAASPPVPAPAPRVVPRQLPAAAPFFAGRAGELADLTAALAHADGGPMVISAVGGAAGIGKTTLAIRWAHQVRDRFPDGQLYAALRGFDPAGTPAEPADVVTDFLTAFDVPAERIPAGLDARVGLYRSVLADKRVLIVLDNARDADQVRPLLPGAAGCLVLITSRDRMTSLVTTDGAHPVCLDVLPSADARDLLARRLGRDRVTAEPWSVHQIIEGCARLPLALAIVAGRAATHPRFPLGALARELHAARDRLDAFAGPDPASDIRSVFSWSYRALTEPAARLYRLLGLHAGPDISTAAAASLAAVPLRTARTLLGQLAQAHLVEEPTPGRYAFHDLLRGYAVELSHATDTDAAHRAAMRRTLDHYLHSAHAATTTLDPHRDPIRLDRPDPDVTVERFTRPEEASAWFEVEHAGLVAAVRLAAGGGHDRHACQLAWTLSTFLFRQGYWHDWAATQEQSLAAAGRLGDRPLRARASRDLAGAYTELGRYADAESHLRRALALFDEVGDRSGVASSHHDLSWVLGEQGHHRQALHHAEQALDCYRAGGDPVEQARTFNAVGWHHAQLRDFTAAIAYCEQALALYQRLGDRSGQGGTWDSIGFAHHHLGAHERAVYCYEQSLAASREAGNRGVEAETLTHLGDTHHAAGNRGEARHAWRSALDILESIGHRDADDLRVRLSG